MDQRSDYIRQDIESTRAALDEKLDTLETKARETFDLKHQVSERPWMALGAAVAAGFVVGTMTGDDGNWYNQPQTLDDYNRRTGMTTDYNRHAYTSASRQGASKFDSFIAQFDDEIEMLKGAAISTITNLLHDSIRAYFPAMGKHLDDTNRSFGRTSSSTMGYSAGSDMSSRTPSTATNTSYDTGTSRAGFDSPPSSRGQSSQLSNPEVGGTGSYYPPGSPGVENRDYVKTYHPPSETETERERTVGEDKGYWREA